MQRAEHSHLTVYMYGCVCICVCFHCNLSTFDIYKGVY